MDEKNHYRQWRWPIFDWATIRGGVWVENCFGWLLIADEGPRRGDTSTRRTVRSQRRKVAVVTA